MSTPDQIAIYTTEDGKAHVRLQLKDGTAWLSQKQMSDLFNVGVSSISKHLKSIYEDGELLREATISKMENVALEQGRSVRRNIEHYNLDAILAVGYREAEDARVNAKDMAELAREVKALKAGDNGT
ncbi:virulence RhuM family protein [Corynebacterium renale]|uniref:Virulence RhuM family protein n=1 Tax=Corynebacterium renale TaxID=1724 RepID=A0A2A9DMN8_9CORY|nr:virulence RhuM family protein [Corynebacterium renale]PFG27425.1 virulence RhuM family protein [Corynebacterium renale]SQI23416.1 Virulence protein [Corynebacterium renale]